MASGIGTPICKNLPTTDGLDRRTPCNVCHTRWCSSVEIANLRSACPGEDVSIMKGTVASVLASTSDCLAVSWLVAGKGQR